MEAREKIEVDLLVSDRVIHNLSESIIDIAAAIHSDKDLCITLNTEGPNIDSLTYRVRDNLITLLESLCLKMSYDQKRIEIVTGNLIENSQANFKITKKNTVGGWFYGKHLSKIKLDLVKKFKYHFGNFVSNSTYPRLLLASHLYHHHGPRTLQSYRRDPKNPGQAVDLDLDRLMFECADPSALIPVTEFIQHLPIELEKGLGEHPKTNMDEGEDGDGINNTIMSWYQEFFCDVVTETFYSGQTFFPTEKITRPLLCRNPFVVHGPIGYVNNLKALGFKTFDRYWSEGYDHLSGYARCKAIYIVFDQIGGMSQQQLDTMYKDMLPRLEHNRKLLLSIDDRMFESLLPKLI